MRLTSLKVLRDQHRGPNVLVSPPSMHHQCPNIRAACYLGLYHLHPVLKTACQFHPGITPNQSNLLDVCLISIQVLSHLKTGSKILVSPSFRLRLNSIQIVITLSQLHADPISNPYRSQDVHFKSIHVLPHLHPGRMIIVSPPSMQSFTSIQCNIFASHPPPTPHPHPMSQFL